MNPERDRERLSLQNWKDDLQALAEAQRQSGPSSSQSILRYTIQKYRVAEVAEWHEVRLGRMLEFVSLHRATLREEFLLEQQEDGEVWTPELCHALYRYLVLMPWKDEIPLPKLARIVALANREL